MEIRIEIVKELEDGSAVITFEGDKEARDFLIGEGLVSVLTKGLELSKTYIKPEQLDAIVKAKRTRRKKNDSKDSKDKK